MSDEQSFEFTPESYPSPEIENQLILELTSIPAKVEVPESLKKQELALIHEAGHATMALYHDRPILGYDCGSKSTWRERVVIVN